MENEEEKGHCLPVMVHVCPDNRHYPHQVHHAAQRKVMLHRLQCLLLLLLLISLFLLLLSRPRPHTPHSLPPTQVHAGALVCLYHVFFEP